MSKDYLEKLRDPRWQKKRLEILERDNWACSLCFNTEKTLHVHHLRYISGREPWEYDKHLLVTLCESCHELEHEFRKQNEQDLLEMLKEKGFLADDIHTLAGGFLNMDLLHIPGVVSCAINYALSNNNIQAYIIEEYLKSIKK